MLSMTDTHLIRILRPALLYAVLKLVQFAEQNFRQLVNMPSQEWIRDNYGKLFRMNFRSCGSESVKYDTLVKYYKTSQIIT